MDPSVDEAARVEDEGKVALDLLAELDVGDDELEVVLRHAFSDYRLDVAGPLIEFDAAAGVAAAGPSILARAPPRLNASCSCGVSSRS